MSKFINDGFTKVAWVTTIAIGCRADRRRAHRRRRHHRLPHQERPGDPGESKHGQPGHPGDHVRRPGHRHLGRRPIELTGYRDNVDDDAYEALRTAMTATSSSAAASR